jgi:hypothetical protein
VFAAFATERQSEVNSECWLVALNCSACRPYLGIENADRPSARKDRASPDFPRTETNMSKSIEFGIDTFGDVTVDADGKLLPHADVIRNVLDEAILADEVGIDFIGVGEHHRSDFAISSPEVMLAGIATRTKRIKLGSA